ncbi:MAG: hypothetical protein WAJ92_10565 [Candidatus Acidiferrales bacterium]
MNHGSVLIVSDDTEFARMVAARWRAERHVPEITLATSDVWHAGSAAGNALVIVGPVREGKAESILSALSAAHGIVSVYVPSETNDGATLRANYPHVLVVPQQDGWTGTLILVAGEALRRVEAAGRAQRAERVALECQGHATLGQYMLDMRPSVNNALTSMVGNADLLLLQPGGISGDCREQIETIHVMALRLNEIMQRFSSLAAEVRASEKESHAETQTSVVRTGGGPRLVM